MDGIAQPRRALPSIWSPSVTLTASPRNCVAAAGVGACWSSAQNQRLVAGGPDDPAARQLREWARMDAEVGEEFSRRLHRAAKWETRMHKSLRTLATMLALTLTALPAYSQSGGTRFKHRGSCRHM
jgi:hypothetical protein